MKGENRPERKVALTGDRTQPPGHEPVTLITEPPGRGMLERILFSSVVMVLAFNVRDTWLKSRLNPLFLPCIYSFVSSLQTVLKKSLFY